MNEFFELEKKCKKLKRKKFIKNLFLTFITLIILGGGYYLFTLFNTKPLQKSKPIITLHKKVIEQNITKKIKIKQNITKEQNITKKIVIPKKVIKKEELNVTKCQIIIKKQIEKTPKKVPVPVIDIDINFSNIKNIENKTQPKQKKIVEKKEPKKEEKKVEVVKEKKKSLIKDETITFKKAYILAKSYYDSEDYVSSMKWCKIASKINNKDERIWELYALNLENTNQKEKAIKVLKTYLKYKKSLRLKYLLQRLEQ